MMPLPPLSTDTKSILLLCGMLDKSAPAKLLVTSEFTKLAQALRKLGMRPADLLKDPDLSEVARLSALEEDRLRQLLNRGVQLAFAVEKWNQDGIWIISRADDPYATLYRNHLKEQAPPLLFGIGDAARLQTLGFGVVGSRNVGESETEYTREMATLCARAGISVVSGGARGVDQTAMNAALDAGGQVLGILSDSLRKTSLDRQARQYLAQGLLTLVTPYHPESRFSVGAAMGRNKLIYAFSHATLVVRSDAGKGGTWAGATEELKRKGSRPVYIHMSAQPGPGNPKLIELGAHPWPHPNSPDELHATLTQPPETKKQSGKTRYLEDLFAEDDSGTSKVAEPDPVLPSATALKSMDIPCIYSMVLPILLQQTASATTAEELSQKLDLHKTQLNAWLARAVKEGHLVKKNKPVRYLAAQKPLLNPSSEVRKTDSDLFRVGKRSPEPLIPENHE